MRGAAHCGSPFCYFLNSFQVNKDATSADKGFNKTWELHKKMFKELTIAVALTVIFSIGVGVLFIRTLIEMVELFFNGEVEKKEPASARGRNNVH